MKRKDEHGVLDPPEMAADIARQALTYFADVLHPVAVSIFFVHKISVEKVKLKPALAKFLAQYEPRIKDEGLYPHQAELLRRYLDGEGPNFILTSATGSGKSLCFWS